MTAAAVNIAVSPETRQVSYTAEMRARSILSRIESLSAKLKTLEDDIRLLWIDFDNLKAGETILGCATKKEFCEKRLHRTPRAIQYLLAGQSNPANRPHKESELSSPHSHQTTITPVVERPHIVENPTTSAETLVKPAKTPKIAERLEKAASMLDTVASQLETLATVTPVTPLAEPAKQFPAPSRTTLLRQWFQQKWKFFKLGSCEHDLVGVGGRMGKYDLLLIGLTPRQVKIVGEALANDKRILKEPDAVQVAVPQTSAAV